MRKVAFLIAGLALCAGPALALEAGDVVIAAPRTPEEAARVALVTAQPEDFAKAEPFETNSGGAGSVAATGAGAFSHANAALPNARGLDFELGRALFEKLWVSAPASTKASDGLGPLYNARACSACHVNDGRGRPPSGPDDKPLALTLHLAVPTAPMTAMAGIEGWQATAPDRHYGAQLQTFATGGLTAEARLRVSWQVHEVTLADGEIVSLRKPAVAVEDLAHGPLAADTMTSPRIAPPMIGLGLLEAIPAADILAKEDPDDADGDGISGRANIVWSPEHGRPMLGRFGLKAGSATVAHQSAKAFANDIGISSPAFPAPWGDCTDAQADCRAAPHGDGDTRGDEIDAEALAITVLYAANLAVPTRRAVDDREVLRGKALFHGAGCAYCHTPKHVTHRVEGAPHKSFQLIWPYTDLLLHDMGPGLADGFVEGRATGREWRTPPLWGIGLTAAVTGETSFLHDGRARSLLEAILWHGGEAEAARDAVAAMEKADRNALIRFLESL
ncbi:di-heme oxidoredictase family protein [Maritimibacter sp. HL-12]|uniref:di-heme oxidoreductase family protein n=1 Tax=Maritimibacter sp. HL-12 TaxID=1162418 RepID=UPI000A0F18BB|nr:di-heme oxidoredictase family protein [Maritimibacter sp. HL-12]SMH47373.1 CxxC motif-containing protein, DUF1111 family [Maritimibacter sp. HL-12]